MDVSTPVVVLYRGNQGAYGIARSLGPLGVPLHLVLQSGTPTPLTASRYWRQVQWLDLDRPAEESLAALLGLAARLAATHGRTPLLLTASDWAAVFIERHADALAEGFVFPHASEPVVTALANKWTMFRAAHDNDVPTPFTVFPQSLQDVEEFLAAARPPIVAKTADPFLPHTPAALIASDGATLLEKFRAEAEHGPPNMILQEFIPGEISDVWMCNAYFDQADGRCRAVYTGRKLRQLSSTGIATLAVCEPNDAVAEQTRRLLESFGYRGCVGVGHRFDARDGTYKLLDVNARISGVFRLFRPTNGIDVVRTCYLDLTGQEVSAGELDVGRKWLLEDDIFVSLPKIARGEQKLRPWLASFRGVREAQWFSPRDPRPFLVWLRASLGRSLRKRVRSADLRRQRPAA